MKTWNDKWGRVNIASINSQNVIEYTEQCLYYYNGLINQMLLTPKPYTWNNTYHLLEIVTSGVNSYNSAIDFSKDIGRLNADSVEFQEVKEKIRIFYNQLYFNKKIALRLNELKKTVFLSKDREYMLDSMIASYMESFYSEEEKKKIQYTNSQLEQYELAFLENMRNARQNQYITFPNIKGIETLDSEMKELGKYCAKEIGTKGYAFNLIPSNYIKLMSKCSSRSMRKVIFQSYVNLASNNKYDNDETLKKLIFWRNKKAKIYGYNNYANYAASNSGLGNVSSIFGFLNNLKNHFELDQQEHSMMIKTYAKDFHSINNIFSWDRYFIKEQINQYLYKKYDLDNIKINYTMARNQMFILAKEMFGLNFTLASQEEYQTWDKDVKAYSVKNSVGKVLGHLVLDIFARENKPEGLIYLFPVNANLKIKRSRMPSQQIIVMALDKKSRKVTLSLDETVTLYHEFGHALHILLTEKKYHQHHPFTIEGDAIEFPSQWFERFAKKPELIGKIAFQDGKAIGKNKARLLIKVEDFYRSQQYWNHILHSKIDIHLNSKFKPNGSKSFHDSLSPIFSEYEQVLQKYNKFQNNQFEHFYMGATYYGYLWAEHMISVWEKEHGKKSLKDQGNIIIKLLNNAVEKPFNQEFEKLVTNAYNEELMFEKNAVEIEELLNG